MLVEQISGSQIFDQSQVICFKFPTSVSETSGVQSGQPIVEVFSPGSGSILGLSQFGEVSEAMPEHGPVQLLTDESPDLDLSKTAKVSLEFSSLYLRHHTPDEGGIRGSTEAPQSSPVLRPGAE